MGLLKGEEEEGGLKKATEGMKSKERAFWRQN